MMRPFPASDHASKDIRSGDLSRAEGVERVRRYDHVRPREEDTQLDALLQDDVPLQ